MKRYAIVRVDETTFCPSTVEGKDIDDFLCSDKSCKNCRYGDTKEQLERKIAQVLFRRKVKLYKKVWGGDMGSIEKKDQYKQCLEIAESIVEFLGV